MRQKLFILFLLFGSFSAFAQKNLLDGTWKLDSVLVMKSSDNSFVTLENVKQNPYFGLFDELIFNEKELIVIENGNQAAGIVEISKDKIIIPFTAAPIEAQYQMEGEQLYLEQYISYPGEGHPDNDLYIVSTKYKRQ